MTSNIGKLPALSGWYFGWYLWYFKLWRELSFDNLTGTPFLNNLAGTHLFFKRGAVMHQKGGQCPLLEKRGFPAKFTIPKCTNRVFLWYSIGMVNTEKYQPIPAKKIQVELLQTPN
jgi:hypothetical protein